MSDLLRWPRLILVRPSKILDSDTRKYEIRYKNTGHYCQLFSIIYDLREVKKCLKSEPFLKWSDDLPRQWTRQLNIHRTFLHT